MTAFMLLLCNVPARILMFIVVLYIHTILNDRLQFSITFPIFLFFLTIFNWDHLHVDLFPLDHFSMPICLVEQTEQTFRRIRVRLEEKNE